MNVNTFFDQIYCINLAHRNDKWQQFSYYAQQAKINVERFEAVDGRTITVPISWKNNVFPEYKDNLGALGCLESHLALLKIAREQNLRNVLIFEDDVSFTKNFHKNLEKSLLELPENWDMFYLYTGHYQYAVDPKKYSKNLYRLQHSLTTSAYAVNQKFYDKAIQQVEQKNQPIDCLYYQIHKDNYCYKSVHRLCSLYQSISDISGEISNTIPADPTLGERLIILAGATITKVTSKLSGRL